MLSSINYVRAQLIRARDATTPMQRLDAILRALDGLDRVQAFAAEQTACIDAVEQGLADLEHDDDLVAVVTDPFLPFPSFVDPEDDDDDDEIEDSDMIVVGANGESWSLGDLLAREG